MFIIPKSILLYNILRICLRIILLRNHRHESPSILQQVVW